jgi:hypothetical protein
MQTLAFASSDDPYPEFQMFSDGKTSHLRLSVHADRGDAAPSWDDAGWMTVSDFEAIGEGTDVNDDGLVVEDPTVISTGPHVTRYVRIEAGLQFLAEALPS